MKTQENVANLTDLVRDRIQRSIEVKQALLLDVAWRDCRKRRLGWGGYSCGEMLGWGWGDAGRAIR